MSKIIIANWKMNLDLKQSIALAKKYKQNAKKLSQVVVCPSEFALVSVADILQKTNLKLGAQNVYWQTNGAHTGEVSAQTLAQLGCQYVIIGHSERRADGESCRLVNLKLKALLATKKIIPIVCVGESLEKRKAGKSQPFVVGQIKRALANIKTKQEIIIAYEPIWAIGTGKAISLQQAEEMHNFLNKLLTKLLGSKDNFKIIYGGSVNSKNASQLLKIDNIDGLLVGGASLKIQDFVKIANIK